MTALVSADTVKCSGCPTVLTAAQMGRRRDGRLNTRCPSCRSTQASSAGRLGREKARREPQRDMKALRVVERYVGFRWKKWTSPEARTAQEALLASHDMTFEELWTHRIKTLAARWDRMMAARQRVEERNAGTVPAAA